MLRQSLQPPLNSKKKTAAKHAASAFRVARHSQSPRTRGPERVITLLRGSWVVVSGVISHRSKVISIVTLLITLHITTHEPPSRAPQLWALKQEGLEAWKCEPGSHDPGSGPQGVGPPSPRPDRQGSFGRTSTPQVPNSPQSLIQDPEFRYSYADTKMKE